MPTCQYLWIWNLAIVIAVHVRCLIKPNITIFFHKILISNRTSQNHVTLPPHSMYSFSIQLHKYTYINIPSTYHIPHQINTLCNHLILPHIYIYIHISSDVESTNNWKSKRMINKNVHENGIELDWRGGGVMRVGAMWMGPSRFISMWVFYDSPKSTILNP